MRVKNEAAWEALLDARDGLLLRLVSFDKAMQARRRSTACRPLLLASSAIARQQGQEIEEQAEAHFLD